MKIISGAFSKKKFKSNQKLYILPQKVLKLNAFLLFTITYIYALNIYTEEFAQLGLLRQKSCNQSVDCLQGELTLYTVIKTRSMFQGAQNPKQHQVPYRSSNGSDGTPLLCYSFLRYKYWIGKVFSLARHFCWVEWHFWKLSHTNCSLTLQFNFNYSPFLQMFFKKVPRCREGGDIGLFITLVPKVL